ncbi:DUF2490 domain-containing protein [Flavobacterium sp. W22_SRS_FP1]|uniref:DUF2490 domain-containing protein n=1 Tax=Flavobacterium sp. W22_SRS_FP1 TaxID=3240276 RepID=UPI003F8F0972
MKNKFKIQLFTSVLLLILTASNVFSQTSKSHPNDFQDWFGSTLKVDLPNGWEVQTDYQARFINGINTYNASYLSLGGSKKISKNLDLLTDYRAAFKQKGVYHRVTFGAEATKNISKFDFGLRVLIQNKLQDFNDVLKEDQRIGFWRTRLKIDYEISDFISVYGATEPVMKFNGVHFVDNWRNTLGLKLSIANRTKLNLYYMYRPDYAKATYNRLYQVVGVNLDYKLKLKKSQGHYLIKK